MSQKGFNAIAGIIILAVLVLVGGVGARYLITKKAPILEIPPVGIPVTEESPTMISQPVVKDETANWKVYRNEQFGFEIKYPTEWFEALVDDGSTARDMEADLLKRDSVVVALFCPGNLPCRGQDLRIHAFHIEDSGYFDYPTSKYFDYPTSKDYIENRVFTKGDIVYRLINYNLTPDLFNELVAIFKY